MTLSFPKTLVHYIFTYTEYPINYRIIATVAHCQPMAAEEYDVDITISEI